MSELWRHADFKRLWSAQAISAFGSRITRTALPVIAVKTLGVTEGLVAVLSALQVAPGVITAMFVGGFVDRHRKRRILVAADLFRGGVVASLTVAWALGVLSLVHLIAVGVLVNIASSLFSIADVAYLPVLVGKDQLVEGNSKLEATEAIAEITGPATAGALFATIGAPLAVVLDAATYLWSALRLGAIRTVEPPPRTADSSASASLSGWQSTKDLRVGMRAVFGHPIVRAVVLSTMVSTIAGGCFMALYVVFVLRVLHLGVATYGVIVAIGGIGSLGGALVARPLARAIGIGNTLLLSIVISCGAFLFIPLASGPRPLVLACLGAHQLLGDGFWVVFVIHAVSLRQTVVPKHLLGRANAVVHVFTGAILPISALLAGLGAELLSVRTAVWIGVSMGLAAPLFTWPLRHLRELPPAAP